MVGLRSLRRKWQLTTGKTHCVILRYLFESSTAGRSHTIPSNAQRPSRNASPSQESRLHEIATMFPQPATPVVVTVPGHPLYKWLLIRYSIRENLATRGKGENELTGVRAYEGTGVRGYVCTWVGEWEIGKFGNRMIGKLANRRIG